MQDSSQHTNLSTQKTLKCMTLNKHTHTQSHCNRTITLKRVQQILMLNGKTIYVQDSQILSRYKPLNIEDSEVTCMTLNKTEDPQHKTDNTKLMTCHILMNLDILPALNQCNNFHIYSELLLI